MIKSILKNFCLSFALLFACVPLDAQSYIPLRIDSLYSWAQSDGFEGDTTIHEYSVGYSYDANDSLIQQRHFPNRPDITPTRFSYSHAGNASYMFGEQIDAFGVWQPFTSTTSVFEGGKIVSKRNDDFVNNTWRIQRFGK